VNLTGNSLDPYLTLEKLAMKKSLIALAVLAASGASFAQSSVTISGTFDPSVRNAKTTYGNGAAVSQNLIGNNGQGTSNFTFKGVEDLGGGLKASFLLENDFDAGNSPNNNFGSLGGEMYTGLEAGFGKVQLGRANTVSLFTQSSSQPFGTKIGSGFGAANTGHVRSDNSIVYTSPVFAGFTVMASYVNQTKATAAGTSAGTIAQGAVSGPASTDIGFLYANGPLTGGVSLWTTAANDVTSNPTTSVAGTASRNKETNAYIAYDFGVAKLGFGYFTEKQDLTGVAVGNVVTGIASGVQTVSTINSTAYNVGATVPLNANLSLLASYTDKNDKTALNLDRKVAAVGLKYTLSARTSVYARYVDDKISNLSALATAQGQKVQTTLVGVQHNF
jgi:predicted porin